MSTDSLRTSRAVDALYRFAAARLGQKWCVKTQWARDNILIAIILQEHLHVLERVVYGLREHSVRSSIGNQDVDNADASPDSEDKPL